MLNRITMSNKLVQFKNCLILKQHALLKEDLWVRDGKILNPEKIFFEERKAAEIQYDCQGLIIAPGFIDAQINGAFGCDFSLPCESFEADVKKVAKKLLSHGVTSFCPTIVTSPPDVYKQIIPMFSICDGSAEGAGILGLHLEGPFISLEKRGAHPPQCILPIKEGFKDLCEVYGDLEKVCLVTVAPELDNALSVIQELKKRNITVSIGHSMADLSQGELAVKNGATFVTHLFNAMLPFHHRDPHLVGLLASGNIPEGVNIFYGMIADGIHTHPAALRIAFRAHPKGMVLVTDAIPAMGLPLGTIYHNGQQQIEVKNGVAYIAGTDTMCGSIAQLSKCVQFFHTATGCSKVEALEAATLHPAQLLNVTDRKGTLEYDTDADFVILDDNLQVHATFIAGQKVWGDNFADEMIRTKVL